MINKNIGFIGLGNVGTKIANNIIKKGYNLYVYHLNEKNYSTSIIKLIEEECRENLRSKDFSSIFRYYEKKKK